MSKIVLSNKYFDTLLPNLNEFERNPFVQEQFLQETFEVIPKIKTPKYVNLTQQQFEGIKKTAHKSKSYRFLNKYTCKIEENARWIEDCRNKSVNQVFHEILPNLFPCKNSKLSNYSFKNMISQFPICKEKVKLAMDNKVKEMSSLNDKVKNVINRQKMLQESKEILSYRIKTKPLKNQSYSGEKINFRDMSSKRNNLLLPRKGVTNFIGAGENVIYNNNESNFRLLQKYNKIWGRYQNHSLKIKFDFSVIKKTAGVS